MLSEASALPHTHPPPARPPLLAGGGFWGVATPAPMAGHLEVHHPPAPGSHACPSPTSSTRWAQCVTRRRMRGGHRGPSRTGTPLEVGQPYLPGCRRIHLKFLLEQDGIGGEA